MKRYAIVRVDDNCPFMQEKLDFSSCSKMFNCDKFIRCEKCEHNCRYGDTKEQLIYKIAQTIFRRKLKVKIEVYKKLTLLYGDGFINKKELKELYLMCLEIAKEIVEFMGVE